MTSRSDDHRTPFTLVTNPTSGAVAELLYKGERVPKIAAVSVENSIGQDGVKRTRLVIEMIGETEVLRKSDGGEPSE